MKYPDELLYHYTENAAEFFAERDLGKPNYRYKNMNEQKPLVIDHQIFVSCQFVLRELIEQLIETPQDVEDAMMYIAAMEVAKQKLIEKFSL